VIAEAVLQALDRPDRWPRVATEQRQQRLARVARVLRGETQLVQRRRIVDAKRRTPLAQPFPARLEAFLDLRAEIAGGRDQPRVRQRDFEAPQAFPVRDGSGVLPEALPRQPALVLEPLHELASCAGWQRVIAGGQIQQPVAPDVGLADRLELEREIAQVAARTGEEGLPQHRSQRGQQRPQRPGGHARLVHRRLPQLPGRASELGQQSPSQPRNGVAEVLRRDGGAVGHEV